MLSFKCPAKIVICPSFIRVKCGLTTDPAGRDMFSEPSGILF